MQQTEKYLNSILQRRIGSIIHPSSFSQKGTTVTRVPLKDENVNSMPTVFRKKYQSFYLSNKQNASQMVINKNTMILSQAKQATVIQQQPPNQKIQYMTISKRIMQKKQSQVIAPAVDVTQHRLKSNSVLNRIIPQANMSVRIDNSNRQKSRLSLFQSVAQKRIESQLPTRRQRQSDLLTKKRKIFT